VREARFGGGHLAVIAGPCAVEDGVRLLEIARGVRARGATLLRGGACKPRTSPYSFQGTGAIGLELLARARLETGLGVVTEVLDPRQVEAVGEVADMFQVGSRNMANTPLLSELGRTRKPVLWKRGFGATLREFLLAAEFVLAGGNTEVVLCERGIRGFDPSTRNVLDVGGVAWLKRTTHLPVIVDPSHAAGRSDLVRPLARAGLAAGADGLIIEVHTETSEARSDGAQAISAEAFALIAKDAAAIAALDRRTVVSLRPSAARAR
jgi:3-deoxy-7-phosphoheptulonate synthase